jgi:hypothetical protein
MKKLFKFGLFAALVTGVVKLVSTQKAQWKGLTESEVRTKLDAKVPSDKVDQMADKIVEGMSQKGFLGEEAPSEV